MANLTENGQQQKAKSPLVVAFRCPPEIRKAMRVRAAQEEISAERVIVEALRLYLGIRPKRGVAA